MKRRLYKLLAVLLVAGMGITVFWNVNHWRLYDDLWQPLALTQAENYCSGIAVASDNYSPNTDIPEGCIETSGMDNTTPSISNSVAWGCQGIASVDPSFPVDACIMQVEQYEIWFLLNGGYTHSWSDARPRPVETVIKSEDARGSNRGDFGTAATTTTAPAEEESTG